MLSHLIIIYKGSEILIEEFPSGDDFIDTKEKIEKFNLDKLREECGVFGIRTTLMPLR